MGRPMAGLTLLPDVTPTKLGMGYLWEYKTLYKFEIIKLRYE